MIKGTGDNGVKPPDYFAASTSSSAGLLLPGDASALMANAGMVPFKEIFTGRQNDLLRRPRRRSARAGGRTPENACDGGTTPSLRCSVISSGITSSLRLAQGRHTEQFSRIDSDHHS